MSETFKEIMNMTIHTLDESSMKNISKMWVYIEEQQEKLQAEREKVALLEMKFTEAVKKLRLWQHYCNGVAYDNDGLHYTEKEVHDIVEGFLKSLKEMERGE